MTQRMSPILQPGSGPRVLSWRRALVLAGVAAWAVLVLSDAPLGAQETAAPPVTAGEGGPPAQAADPPAPPMLPKRISVHGREIDYLFWLISWITGVTFVIVQGLLIYFLIRYRHREGRTTASNTHGSHRLEITWTAGTALILVFLAFAQRASWIQVKQTPPPLDQSLLVRVYAEQFAWYFNYPGKDGSWEPQRATYVDKSLGAGGACGLDAPENDITLTKLVVPADTDVVLELHSLGKYEPNTKSYTYPVLHSFFSPHLRIKQDVVPFYPGRLWFRIEPGMEGMYEIACAELCGEGHYTMHAELEVVSPEAFEDAVGYDWRAANPGTFPEAVHYHQEMRNPE